MISIPSFAKINLGLRIGPARADGFHELRTIYQTLAIHDVVHTNITTGSGIEIRCGDPRVPLDESNTCYKVAERVLGALDVSANPSEQCEQQIPRRLMSTRDDKRTTATAAADGVAPHRGKIVIEIEKHLPVQGGMGAASSNAVATMLGLEQALGIEIAQSDKLRIAAEVGSDLPLFLIGGTVLGVGRGEEVYPLADLPTLHVVVVTPPVGVSTPKAFARWDELNPSATALTGATPTGTIDKFSATAFAWLNANFPQACPPNGPGFDVAGLRVVKPASGVPAVGGDRAETPLLDLVRAGIENDFERVVFPEYPELREVKELLQREGAQYASLSGSGSTLYGLFASAGEAQAAAERMRAAGHLAVATTTLTREEYWKVIARG
jgi:4-diphosphocytidyl-2-C-methyl-D-erythritol kinase